VIWREDTGPKGEVKFLFDGIDKSGGAFCRNSPLLFYTSPIAKKVAYCTRPIANKKTKLSLRDGVPLGIANRRPLPFSWPTPANLSLRHSRVLLITQLAISDRTLPIHFINPECPCVWRGQEGR
jgi:hypothetical protein